MGAAEWNAIGVRTVKSLERDYEGAERSQRVAQGWGGDLSGLGRLHAPNLTESEKLISETRMPSGSCARWLMKKRRMLRDARECLGLAGWQGHYIESEMVDDS